MITFSGRFPLFSSLYLVRAFIMAGLMDTAISWPVSWSSQLLVNLEKLEMMRKPNKQSNKELTW